MTRTIRYFSFLLFFLFSLSTFSQPSTLKVYISTKGNDTNLGTQDHPFFSLDQAVRFVADTLKKEARPVEIILEEGDYFLEQTVTLSSDDFPDLFFPIEIKGEGNVLLSGGIPLYANWEVHEGDIWKASVQHVDKIPALFTEEGRLLPARYPNFKEGVYPFGGFSEDALSPERVKTWKNPKGGYIHAMHRGRWGGMHYEIKGKNEDNSLVYEGGWQNNRPSEMHPTQRYVENIFEELDAPGEWFYKEDERKLYYYAKEGENPNEMHFVVGNLEAVISLVGSLEKPMKNINIRNITFSHTRPTFMRTKEQLMRSDWSIYRKGAVLLNGTEHCKVENNDFRHLGGHAVFVNGYNRQGKIKGNLIEHIGGNGLAFVGQADAVRSPSYRYEEYVAAEEMDTLRGPKTENYPADFLAEDDLIRFIGEIEKQVAGVQIQMASRITVRHNTIYKVPRAGINIGDGAWGGHILEYNDVFETVLETGDHGAFNAWGRDRFWHPNRRVMDSLTTTHPEWILLDAVETTHIRHNRFHCDYGWDIDLDDGATNYKIYNNLCLSGGIKLREGFYREVYNNLLINNGFHPHVWFKNSKDEFKHNLVMAVHQPIGVQDWGDQVDSNIFVSERDLHKAQDWGVDAHSIWTEPQFVDAESGDFHLVRESEVLKSGFEQLDFEKTGVISARLKEVAATPPVPTLLFNDQEENNFAEIVWHGVVIKTVETLGEQSAAGLNEIKGVLILDIPRESPLAEQGLEAGDVILACFGDPTDNVNELRKSEAANRWKGRLELDIWRNQQPKKLNISLSRE